jgi:hypothetical protein
MPQRVQSLRSSTKLSRPTAGSREPGELYVNFADLQLGVSNAAKNSQDLLAVRFFSTATDYVAGDFVIQAGVGYKAKGSITAGAFNPSQWDTIATGATSEPPIAAGTTSQYWRGDKSWQTLDKTAVGLANVDNTADASKPISGPTQAALNLKAPLASPTFTGTVIAPTQATGTSNTTVATTEFVARDFAPIMSPQFGGDARAVTPATADNDTSIATTAYVKANLVNYAPINSPIFTGIPVAPTPSPGDNDTSIATTAFVQDAIGNRPADAPSDGNWYGRRNGGWADVTEEAPADGVSYGRKNGAWVASVGGAVISDTPPPGPLTPGQLWYESDSGNTYLWYQDADTSQWVQQNIAAPITEMPSGLTAETRNRIVNGAMQISQENGVTSVASGSYPVDQILLGSNIATVTAAKAVLGVNASMPYACSTTIGTGKPALASADLWHLVQYIEGTRIADFRWGTGQAKQAVARFSAYSNAAGTFTFYIKNAVPDRTFLAPFTIAAALTWQDFSIVIPGDTTGTWASDTSTGLRFGWGFAAGSTLNTGVAGWQAGNPVQMAAHTNLAATAGNSFYVTNVGLYLDPLNSGVPPRWQMPDEAEELRACQRYWSRIQTSWTGYTGGAGTGCWAYGYLPTVARTSPSLTGTNSGNGGSSPAAVGSLSFAHGTMVQDARTSTGAGGGYFVTVITANARM